MRNLLYVGILPAGVAVADLAAMFGRCGSALSAAVVADTGVSGGAFGVVEMQTQGVAEAAIAELDGSRILGHTVSVRWASAPEQTACGRPPMFGSMNMTDDA